MFDSIISGNELAMLLHCPNNCGRSYTGKNAKGSLKRHLTYECGIDPQFKCNYCSKQFTLKESLKRHLISIHKTFLSLMRN